MSVNRVKICFLLIGFLLICGVNILSAENFNPYLTYHCYKTESAIKIDGKLDEEAWKNAIPTPVFGDIVTGEAPRYSVKAKMLWDENYLYIAYEMESPNVWAFKTIRDDPMCGQLVGKISGIKNMPSLRAGWGSYIENFIKFYIDPDADGCNYIEMHVSPLNKICDKWQERPWRGSTQRRMGLSGSANPHPEWDCPGLKTAVSIKGTLNDSYDVDEGWTVEMAIPFSSLKQFTGKLNCPPKEDDIWKMHLGRRYQAKPQTKAKDVSYWTWPVIGVRNCHEPDRWGAVVFKDKRGTQPKELKNLSKSNFKWKALWVRASSATALEDIKKMVEFTDKMGFNVLIFQATGSYGKCWYNSKILNKSKKIKIDPLREVIKEAKKKKIKVYAWTINLRVPTKEYSKSHPEYFLQKVKPYEQEAIGKPRVNPDRLNVHYGRWFCPDQGLVDFEKDIIEELVRNYDIDGIAIDYLGYRNYYACFCDYSNKKRKEFAMEHPKLSEKEVMTQFSEQSLVNWTKQLRKTVQDIKPNLKLAIHIYPDFDLNPKYGNKLYVDYCGQTIAWFYKPFWSYGKIHDKAIAYKQAEGKYHRYNRYVPFVGVYTEKRLKSPERLRAEIRIAGASGADTIMLAFYGTFAKRPDLAKVVAEELK